MAAMAPKRQKTSGAADTSQQTLAAAFARPAAREEREEGGDTRPQLFQFMRVLAGVPEFDDYTVNNILNDASGGYHADTAERAEDGAQRSRSAARASLAQRRGAETLPDQALTCSPAPSAVYRALCNRAALRGRAALHHGGGAPERGATVRRARCPCLFPPFVLCPSHQT